MLPDNPAAEIIKTEFIQNNDEVNFISSVSGAIFLLILKEIFSK